MILAHAGFWQARDHKIHPEEKPPSPKHPMANIPGRPHALALTQNLRVTYRIMQIYTRIAIHEACIRFSKGAPGAVVHYQSSTIASVASAWLL